MPTKTIYVADGDLPIFERAQALAGDNLSATIVQALRRFVEAQEATEPTGGQFAEHAVQIGDHGTYLTRRFRGRVLARRQMRDQEHAHVTLQTVYETAKGHFAVHTAVRPDWAAWSMMWSRRARGRRDRDSADGEHAAPTSSDWASIYGESNAFTLDVYDTLDELRDRIAPPLFAAVENALRGPEAEFLDI